MEKMTGKSMNIVKLKEELENKTLYVEYKCQNIYLG